MTIHMKACPRCGAPAYLEADTCLQCEHRFRSQFRPPAPPEYQPQQLPPLVPFARKTDPFALVAFVLGIVSIPLMCSGGTIAAIAALCIGAVSLFRIREDHRLGGLGYAITGMVLSLIPIMWAVILALSLLAAKSTAATPLRGLEHRPYEETREELLRRAVPGSSLPPFKTPGDPFGDAPPRSSVLSPTR